MSQKICFILFKVSKFRGTECGFFPNLKEPFDGVGVLFFFFYSSG